MDSVPVLLHPSLSVNASIKFICHLEMALQPIQSDIADASTVAGCKWALMLHKHSFDLRDDILKGMFTSSESESDNADKLLFDVCWLSSRSHQVKEKSESEITSK